MKDQGTGSDAWQKASERTTQIQRVLDLRAEIAAEDPVEVERKRFLLAEQFLEKIGDEEAALAEYASLAEDAEGTEWGSRALYAKAESGQSIPEELYKPVAKVLAAVMARRKKK